MHDSCLDRFVDVEPVGVAADALPEPGIDLPAIPFASQHELFAAALASYRYFDAHVIQETPPLQQLLATSIAGKRRI
ncbi:hypothetical protein [Cohnella sp. JJ-181]|uniref:hypothetical protein n=1 Tax=Cohnella rhizoplanae TaxID=2974897 RepID=UPI00232E2DD8|nr:hypothetical protein [Cohnella sp. JJ-181]